MNDKVQKNSVYKFSTNLLRASSSQNIEDAKNEWYVIYDEVRDKIDGLCICQRKVKYVTYMFNVITKNTIIVGSKCSKKFNMNRNMLNNNILNNTMKNKLSKGEYINIDNIITYCKSIEEELLNHFLTEFDTTIKKYRYYDNCSDDNVNDIIWVCFMEDYYRDLIKISCDMEELIQQYNLSYLTKLCKSIKNKILTIRKKIYTKYDFIKAKENQKIIKMECLKQLLREQKQKMNNTILKERNDSSCYITKYDACKCKYPYFINDKYRKNFCIMCYKQKNN